MAGGKGSDAGADHARSAAVFLSGAHPEKGTVHGGKTIDQVLVDHIGQHASPLGDAPTTRDELKTLTQFRSTWSRLSADRRLTQSQATVPQNAGPLNSHHLVHRSLRLMRDVSPEYLNRFMSYVDALSWIDQLNGAAAAAANAASPRAESPKKSGRGKAS